MRHAFIWVVILISLLTSCQPTVIPVGPMVKKIDSEELSRLVLNFSAELKKVHHLDLEDSYAAYDDNIKKICLKYSSQRLLTLKEARLLIVEVVEDFLQRLNNHTVLAFELEAFPFTAHNLDVQINFESFHGLYLDPLYIGQIWLQCACVHFYAFDRKIPRIDWNHYRFEPYFKSRELALIQKEVDVPYYEGQVVEPEGMKEKTYLFDRYEPYRPVPPYSARTHLNVVHGPPGAPMPGVATDLSAYYRQTSVPVRPTQVYQQPISRPISVPVQTQPVRTIYTPSNLSLPSVTPGLYPANNSSDLPPYSQNRPASAGTFYQPNFYSDIPPYNPDVPATSGAFY